MEMKVYPTFCSILQMPENVFTKNKTNVDKTQNKL